MSLAWAGCRRSDCTPNHEGGLWRDDLQIVGIWDSLQQATFFSVRAGTRSVFWYERVEGQCNLALDDEYTEKFYFYLDPSLESFEWTDSAAFAQANCFHQESGAWVGGQSTVRAGRISGERVSDKKWKIEVDVELSNALGTRLFQCEGRFIKR